MILVKNPQASYLAYKAEIDQAIQRVLDSGWYLNGPETEALEYEFAKQNGSTAAVAVGSGTVGLFLALQLWNISPGDEVVMPAMAPVPVMSAIMMAGAIPVICDVSSDTMALDINKIEITKKTRAIILIHPYGLSVDKTDFEMLAPVIEDCSHAHGAKYNGKKVGSTGPGVFSCYPTKNLSALGDAGLITVDYLGDAIKLQRLRQYGGVSEIGVNGRIDEIQAAILRVKLVHLLRDTTRRWEIARFYNKYLLSWIGRQSVPLESIHVYHQYVIKLPYGMFQAYFIEKMRSKGIQVQVHYEMLPNEWHWPVKCGDLSNAEELSRRLVSLPIYPELTSNEAEKVVEAVNGILG